MSDKPTRTQKPCAPLDWESQFILLMSKMSYDITMNHDSEDPKIRAQTITLARYQTIIAAGCYFGERAAVLLKLRWIDLLNEEETVLRQSKVFRKRTVFIHPNLRKIAEKNMKVVDPESLHLTVIHNHQKQPISTVSFNMQLKKYFEKYGIKTKNPTSHTLRKTFARRLFVVEGGDTLALGVVQKALDHNSLEYTADYIGVTAEKIRSGMEKM